MSVELWHGNSKVGVKQWLFSAGEVGVQILPYEYSRAGGFNFVLNFTSNDDLFTLANLVDAVKRKYGDKLYLTLDMVYIPYARQDRVCFDGESHALKVFANFINSLGFDKVTGYDPHSTVCEAVFDNFKQIEQHTLAQGLSAYINPANTIIVAPDNGAEKKVLKVAEALGVKRIIMATKVRGEGGKIISTDVTIPAGATTDDVFLIVDDVCDYGGTFINLAKEIKKQLTGAQVWLYTTNAIYPVGTSGVLEHVDKLFCYNSLKAQENLIILKGETK